MRLFFDLCLYLVPRTTMRRWWTQQTFRIFWVVERVATNAKTQQSSRYEATRQEEVERRNKNVYQLTYLPGAFTFVHFNSFRKTNREQQLKLCFFADMALPD